MAKITYENGELVYRTRYDPQLVNKLKFEIPPADRSWDTVRKVWKVAPKHAKVLQDLTLRYLKENVAIPPTMPAEDPIIVTRMFRVMYIGMTKNRPGAAERSSYGCVDGEWSVIFPERVLMTWFGVATNSPADTKNLYAMLGTVMTADQEAIKKAYRRMARQWHPDVCQEPDATDVFQQINRAYEVLSDTKKRARYNAGLQLMASIKRSSELNGMMDLGYRPPLRCGWILAEGITLPGGFVVNKIFAWEDIVSDDLTLTLVTSWRIGARTFTESWV